ncbi:uncharacterized protein KIAA1143 homolog [Cylas formicarius]|uniref:uncharacterized protein KIAA1143 homolog n=1 Tax=Cylas formicarius TaxID=197179 RepID=UPI002958C11D|nr:uncharacterized protein KIAA1143 homolog [Cylas formicarius]
MSKKHHISYVKPSDPSFLKKLKEQIGYKEGPTVDTKREDLGPVSEQDFQDNEDEQPQVVVLSPGDLTAEEAAKEKLRLEKEEQETPADLNAPILFKAPDKSKPNSEVSSKQSVSKRRSSSTDQTKKSSKKIKNSSLLSFDDEEDE